MTSTYEIEIVGASNHSTRFRIKNKAKYLSFKEVFRLWETDEDFVKYYVWVLNAFEYKALYWEHPALTSAYLDKRYECIVKRSRPLEKLPINETAFANWIKREEPVADFMNLGKNARLVIPTQESTEEIYNHLGKFLRLADENQILAFFQRIGSLIEAEIQAHAPIWLNTAGLGVLWLHVRMDTRPKYYKTEPYKKPDFLEKMK